VRYEADTVASVKFTCTVTYNATSYSLADKNVLLEG